jgi:hypothetical protein
LRLAAASDHASLTRHDSQVQSFPGPVNRFTNKQLLSATLIPGT